MTDETILINSDDVEKNKVWAVLAYFIFFLPLLTAKDSKYAMFHANQGLMLLISWFIAFFVSLILAFIPIIGWLISLLIYIGILILWIMGLIGAASGKMNPLPVLGAMKIIK